jgi:catechol 2,3-dioxygenase-like lactoylglutathione lyase family enzyme
MGPHGIPNADRFYLGTTPESATNNTGVVDHIAFSATEPESLAARLETLGVPMRKRFFAEFRLFQIFVKDPDGLTIELNFHGIETEPAWGEGSENYADMPSAGARGT